MQEFSTAESRHLFVIDGKQLWLPGVTIADFEVIRDLGNLTTEEQIPKFRDLILERVRGGGFWGFLTRRTRASRLSPIQHTQLFNAWIGLDPGEASASPVSSAPTAQNS